MSAMFVFYVVLNSTQISNWSGRISIAYSKKVSGERRESFQMPGGIQIESVWNSDFFIWQYEQCTFCWYRGSFFKIQVHQVTVKLLCFLRKH